LVQVGTGTGQFLYYAKNYFNEVYGTEVSCSAINIVKEKYKLDITEGDIVDIEFKTDMSFDNITLFHVLEHVTDPKKVIEKCRLLLNKEGILIIAVPNDILSLKSKTKIVLNKMGMKRFRNTGRQRTT